MSLIKRIDLQSIDTMKKWFKTLKIAIRFFIKYLMTTIKKKYDSLFKFCIKSLKWLFRWKIAIVSIKQYELFEFKKNVWLHNFVAWIRLHSSELTLMLKIKISDVFINSLSNYSVIIRKVKKHLRNEIKKRVVRNNAFNAILNDEKNDKMKIVVSHASKKQRINIRKEFRSINKSIKRSCWTCEKKSMKFKNVDIFFLILHLNFLSFSMLCSNNFWKASKTITSWKKNQSVEKKRKNIKQINRKKQSDCMTIIVIFIKNNKCCISDQC